jgi:hypothetical protein
MAKWPLFFRETADLLLNALAHSVDWNFVVISQLNQSKVREKLVPVNAQLLD